MKGVCERSDVTSQPSVKEQATRCIQYIQGSHTVCWFLTDISHLHWLLGMSSRWYTDRMARQVISEDSPQLGHETFLDTLCSSLPSLCFSNGWIEPHWGLLVRLLVWGWVGFDGMGWWGCVGFDGVGVGWVVVCIHWHTSDRICAIVIHLLHIWCDRGSGHSLTATYICIPFCTHVHYCMCLLV